MMLAVKGGRRPRQAPADEPGMIAELREGWAEFTKHTWLWATVIQYCLVMMAWNGAFNVLGPVVARQHYGGALAWSVRQLAKYQAALESGAGPDDAEDRIPENADALRDEDGRDGTRTRLRGAPTQCRHPGGFAAACGRFDWPVQRRRRASDGKR